MGQAGDLGRFRGERDKVVPVESAEVGVPEGAGERRNLPAHAFEESMDVVRLGLRVVALLVLGVLGREAGHALPDVALHAGDAPARDDGRGAEC